MTDIDPLLAGAIDLHVHGYPDMGFDLRARLEDITVAEMSRDYGLRGFALKSHFWPTMDRAYQLNQRLASDAFTVFSSITLNPLAGGLSAMSVEAAAAHGAKLVFLPTWGSCHDHHNRGVVYAHVLVPKFPSIPRTLDAHGALSVLDANGHVLPEVHDIIAVCKERGLTLCTGHVSPSEGLAVFRAARAAGLERLIATHPFAPATGATVEEAREFIELGATVEFTFAVALSLNNPFPLRRTAELVREFGAANCILTTDAFFEFFPPQPEALRIFTHELNFLGVPEDDIRTMIVDNPRRLLALEAD